MMRLLRPLALLVLIFVAGTLVIYLDQNRALNPAGVVPANLTPPSSDDPYRTLQ